MPVIKFDTVRASNYGSIADAMNDSSVLLNKSLRSFGDAATAIGDRSRKDAIAQAEARVANKGEAELMEMLKDPNFERSLGNIDDTTRGAFMAGLRDKGRAYDKGERDYYNTETDRKVRQAQGNNDFAALDAFAADNNYSSDLSNTVRTNADARGDEAIYKENTQYGSYNALARIGRENNLGIANDYLQELQQDPVFNGVSINPETGLLEAGEGTIVSQEALGNANNELVNNRFTNSLTSANVRKYFKENVFGGNPELSAEQVDTYSDRAEADFKRFTDLGDDENTELNSKVQTELIAYNAKIDQSRSALNFLEKMNPTDDPYSGMEESEAIGAVAEEMRNLSTDDGSEFTNLIGPLMRGDSAGIKELEGLGPFKPHEIKEAAIRAADKGDDGWLWSTDAEIDMGAFKRNLADIRKRTGTSDNEDILRIKNNLANSIQKEETAKTEFQRVRERELRSEILRRRGEGGFIDKNSTLSQRARNEFENYSKQEVPAPAPVTSATEQLNTAINGPEIEAEPVVDPTAAGIPTEFAQPDAPKYTGAAKRLNDTFEQIAQDTQDIEDAQPKYKGTRSLFSNLKESHNAKNIKHLETSLKSYAEKNPDKMNELAAQAETDPNAKALMDQYRKITGTDKPAKVADLSPADTSMRDFIKKGEGFRAEAYDDNGERAIGSGLHVDAPHVKEAIINTFDEATYNLIKGGAITEEQDNAIVDKMIEIGNTELGGLIKGFADLNTNVRTGLMDMWYNKGLDVFKNGSPKFMKALENKDWDEVLKEVDTSTNRGKRRFDILNEGFGGGA